MADVSYVMAVMDPALGDYKVVWDPDKPEEVRAAAEQFDSLKRKGYVAFRTAEDGSRSTVMHTFDPKAKEVIMAPMVAGG